MKKRNTLLAWILMSVVITCVGCSADLYESFSKNYKDLSTEQLTAISKAVDDELISRLSGSNDQTIREIAGGTYVCGTDIPNGRYRIVIKSTPTDTDDYYEAVVWRTQSLIDTHRLWSIRKGDEGVAFSFRIEESEILVLPQKFTYYIMNDIEF